MNYGGNRLLSKLKYKYEPIQNLFLANTKWRRNISKQSDNQNTWNNNVGNDTDGTFNAPYSIKT